MGIFPFLPGGCILLGVMDPAIQKQLIDIALIVAGFLFVGALVALVLVRTTVSRRERRQRKVSAARRASNTHYDLFARSDAGEAEPSSNKRRRGRKSSRPHQTIDILNRNGDGTAATGTQGDTPPEAQ